MTRHDRDEPDDHASEPDSRPATPTRPAWDAATYGLPSDVRLPPASQRARTRRTKPPAAQPPARSRAAVRDERARGAAPPGTSATSRTPATPATDLAAQAVTPVATPSAALPSRSPVGPPAGGSPTVGATNVSPQGGAAVRSAGRNLPAAIAVGVGMAATALLALFVWRPAFVVIIAVAATIGAWELVRAIRISGANPPLVPLLAGGVLMLALAWWGQASGLTFGLIVTLLSVMVWRLAEGADGYGRDVAAAALVAVYVPFLAGFAALLAQPADGDLRVIAALAGVVLSDTGGYVAGVRYGRHPMAPTVSPKKSWEGLAGSLAATALGGAVLLPLLFGSSMWFGLLFGLGVAAAAVVGDLGESMLKRDLGVKDMSQLLPGHGGMMDRLDSIVFVAPAAYGLLSLFAPPA